MGGRWYYNSRTGGLALARGGAVRTKRHISMKPVDDGYRMLAAQCLRKQARRLGRQVKRVGQEVHIEAIHQARVAARRLTAAMRAFGPILGDRKSRRWQDNVGRALRRLGDARDKDVQIELIRQALKQTPERALRPGIRRLLLRLQQQRRDLQPKVRKAARNLRRSGTLKAVRKHADAMAEALPPTGATIQTPFVFDTARRRIVKRLGELMAYEACLSKADEATQHHRMRIAAKRLRYTMELFRPAYEGDLDGCLSAMKKLQDLLGDLHDCDVWLQLLPDFLADESKRAEAWFGKAPSASSSESSIESPIEPSMKKLRAGIEHLQASRLGDRERIFAELGQYWRQLRDAGAFDAMTALLSEHVARAEAMAAEQAARQAEEAKAAEEAARLVEEAARQPQEANQAPPAPETCDSLTKALNQDAAQSEDWDDEDTQISFASPSADTLDWPLGHYVPCEPPSPSQAGTLSDPPAAQPPHGPLWDPPEA